MYENFWIMRIYFLEWINVSWRIICITKWLSFPVDSHQTMRNGCYFEFYLIEWFAIKPTTFVEVQYVQYFVQYVSFTTEFMLLLYVSEFYIIWEIAIGLNFDSNLKVKINFWISIKICKINQMIKCRNKWLVFFQYTIVLTLP